MELLTRPSKSVPEVRPATSEWYEHTTIRTMLGHQGGNKILRHVLLTNVTLKMVYNRSWIHLVQTDTLRINNYFSGGFKTNFVMTYCL